jgi:hypothetical protein
MSFSSRFPPVKCASSSERASQRERATGDGGTRPRRRRERVSCQLRALTILDDGDVDRRRAGDTADAVGLRALRGGHAAGCAQNSGDARGTERVLFCQTAQIRRPVQLLSFNSASLRPNLHLVGLVCVAFELWRFTNLARKFEIRPNFLSERARGRAATCRKTSFFSALVLGSWPTSCACLQEEP